MSENGQQADSDQPLLGRHLSLASVGLNPDHVLYAETFRVHDILAYVDGGLDEKSLVAAAAAVVGEGTRLSLIASLHLLFGAYAQSASFRIGLY